MYKIVMILLKNNKYTTSFKVFFLVFISDFNKLVSSADEGK